MRYAQITLYFAILLVTNSSAQVCDTTLANRFELIEPPFSTQYGESYAFEGNHMLVGAPDHGFTSVDSDGLVWPYFFDGVNWQELHPLAASDRSTGSGFGKSISLEGATAVIGAVCQYGMNTSKTGAAYVYEYDGVQWSETAKLAPPPGSGNCDFGQYTAFQGGKIYVSFEVDNTGPHGEGAIYIYENLQGGWMNTEILYPTTSGEGGKFGCGFDIDHDVLAVRTRGLYVISDRIDYVSVFRRTNDEWVEEQIIPNPEEQTRTNFGESVAVDGDRMIVGARSYEVNNDPVGAAFIYEFDGTNWIQTKELNAPKPEPFSEYGFDVSLSGDTALVSARLASHEDVQSGKVFIYRHIEGDWQLSGEIVPDVLVDVGEFGYSVEIRGTTVLASAISSSSPRNESGFVNIYELLCNNGCQNTADTNGDGLLTPTDFNAWINAFNNQLPTCDQNGDGACTPTDFNAWIANYNAGCP